MTMADGTTGELTTVLLGHLFGEEPVSHATWEFVHDQVAEEYGHLSEEQLRSVIDALSAALLDWEETGTGGPRMLTDDGQPFYEDFDDVLVAIDECMAQVAVDDIVECHALH